MNNSKEVTADREVLGSTIYYKKKNIPMGTFFGLLSHQINKVKLLVLQQFTDIFFVKNKYTDKSAVYGLKCCKSIRSFFNIAFRL